jgi:hypothetical protein
MTMASLSWGVLVAVACSWLAPAGAGAQTEPVRPILECVVENGPGDFTAHFGYLSHNSVPVTIPIGADNKFTPSPQDRGQPTLFDPGRTPFYPDSAFQVDFDGSNLVWTLDGRTSTASSGSTRCPVFAGPPQSICYRTLRARGAPKPDKVVGIQIEDPFQDKRFDIKHHKMICTPATIITATSSTDVDDPNAHSAGRKIARSRTKPAQPRFNPHDPNHQALEVTDALGTLSIDVRREDRVLVATAICDPGSESCPSDASLLDTSGLDTDLALTCYRVRVTPGTPKFEKERFQGSDRFQSQVYRASRPKLLCSVANKEGGNPGAITDPTYQLCYRIFVAQSYCEPGAPPLFALQECRSDDHCGGANQCITYPERFRHQRVPNLQANNEFGPETLQTYYEELVCLDATIAP